MIGRFCEECGKVLPIEQFIVIGKVYGKICKDCYKNKIKNNKKLKEMKFSGWPEEQTIESDGFLGWYNIEKIKRDGSDIKTFQYNSKPKRFCRKKHFLGVRFDSKEERQITELFVNRLPLLGFIPKQKVNCHVKMADWYKIDWFIESIGCFVEYHPWDRKRTADEYKQEREKIVRTGSNAPVICLKTLEEVDNLAIFLENLGFGIPKSLIAEYKCNK